MFASSCSLTIEQPRKRCILRRIRFGSWGLAVLMVLQLLFVVQVPTASADPVPPTNYSPIDIGDMPRARHALTDINGGVTVGCGEGDPVEVFKSFDAAGQQLQSHARVDPYGQFCPPYGVIGRDGTVFSYAKTNNSYTRLVQAWKDNSLVWQYTVPCGANGVPTAMTMGVDGNVYFAVGGGSSPCATTQLIGLTPTAQSGGNVPQVVMNQSFGDWVLPSGLAAYDDGLVLHFGNAIQHISYTGTRGTPISYTPMQGYYGYGDQFGVTTSGRAFVATKASPGTVTGCQWPDNVAGSILAIDPSGVVWSKPLQPCSYVYEMRPTYNGGAVVHINKTDTLGSPLQQTLLALDKNGEQLWANSFGTTNATQPRNDIKFAVDLNGNVAVQNNVTVTKSINGSTWHFPEIRFRVLSGTTGDSIPSMQFDFRGDSTTSNGPSYLWTDGDNISIAKNTAYIVASQCTTIGNCDPNTTKLYAFTVPGLEMDYPRGAILQADKPWKNYVALGDSFSSGEGVEPFDPATNVGSGPNENRCHRSERAFAKLLAGSPRLRLQLKAFKACSGAESEHVLQGWPVNHELAQVDALTADTDVVTISLGGNDIGFSQFGTICVLSDCTPAKQDMLTTIGGLQYDLGPVYERIQARVGADATVYVVGYPHLLPPWSQVTLGCGSGGWPVGTDWTQSEVETIREITNALNAKIKETAEAAPYFFTFVDPNTADSPFRGHELCSTQGESYFLYARLWPDREYSFHPNLKGQDAYRRVVAKKMVEVS